jgi:hypothetical protein
MKIERTPTGKAELRLSDDTEQFKSLAEAVRRKLAGKWVERLDDFDRSYWDLDVQGQTITVHREHFLGVSVFCDDEPAKTELLEQLKLSFEAEARR